ncbi:carbohydrate ABC transporter permease [Diplocloster hominis]|uniref:carbohydrate ABC transporter permease n=1 Tax=Diplocloster hominis TaxID=3079010 RepID=UPI0031BB2579
MNSKKWNAADVVCRLLVLGAVLVTLYPIVFVSLTSLKATSEFYTNIWGIPREFKWSNYYSAWVTSRIGEYFKTSIIVVGISVLMVLVCSALAGYALSRLKVRYVSAAAVSIILITQLMPLESVIMPLYLMMSRMKLLNGYLTLILPYIGWGMPLTVLIYKNYFDTIPQELMEAAKIDGCSEIQCFMRIAVPVMKPATATNAIFNFVGLWGELLWASVSTATSRFGTLPVGIISFRQQFATDWGPMSAAICIVILPLILIFCFLQKYFVQGLSNGAVKG